MFFSRSLVILCITIAVKALYIVERQVMNFYVWGFVLSFFYFSPEVKMINMVSSYISHSCVVSSSFNKSMNVFTRKFCVIINKYKYICASVCVCACARVCERECLRVRESVRVCVYARAFVFVCLCVYLSVCPSVYVCVFKLNVLPLCCLDHRLQVHTVH